MTGTTSFLTLATVASALLVGGLLALLLGNLTRLIQDRLTLTDPRRAGLKAVFLLGLMGLMMLGGLLVHQFGIKDMLIFGSIAACFSIACLGLSTNFPAALTSAGLLGGATGLLHTAITVAMPYAFFDNGSDVLNHAPAAVNLGYVFVALGGLLLPYLTVYALGKLKYRNGLLALALLALVPACLAAAIPNATLPEPGPAADVSLLFHDVRFWLAVVAVFFFYGLESSALTWAPSYLTEIGLSDRAKLILVIFFWAIFLSSRLLCATLAGILVSLWIAMIFTFVSAALLGNMIGIYRTKNGATCFLLLAFCLGPIFPTIAGLILYLFRTASPALAFGLACGLGGLGRLAFTPLIDRLVAGHQVRLAMGATVVMALVVFFPLLIWLTLPK